MTKREPGDPSGLVTALGIFLYMLAGVPILVGGLIMPVYAVGALGAVWLIGLVVAIRWRHRRGLLFVLPFALVGLWFLVAWAGETFLDWTA